MAEDQWLFNPAEFPPPPTKEPAFAPLRYPLWTEHKARLIARYLYYFVMITKHGTYIDGFAGPQNKRHDMWAAKLVLESQPRWLRHFHLVELDPDKIKALEEIQRADQGIPTIPRRNVHLYQGDFNLQLDAILSARTIAPKEATFCLLDQRTFECQWASIERLATYKPVGENKIELFYFLPISWLDRAFAATKDPAPIVRWWGQPDWAMLRSMTHRQRADAFVARLRDDLHYTSVLPWPIYENQGSTRVMYYMIHATDHPDAPKLMRRAYSRAVDPVEPIEQLKLDWEREGASVTT